jgi:hypothetical protein
MAFFVAFIWVAIRFCSGFDRYLLIAICTAFCLFWIRDLLFGFRLRLISDGSTICWQEGKETGSVPLAQIRKVLIGVREPAEYGFGSVSRTFVRLQLSNGVELALPPNIGTGLRSKKWRHLKRLVSQIRTISDVSVEPIDEPDLSVEGWQDEQCAASSASPNTRFGNSGGAAWPPSAR